MSLIDDAKKAGLSPDEIEALEAAEAEERAGQEALQAIANEGGNAEAEPAPATEAVADADAGSGGAEPGAAPAAGADAGAQAAPEGAAPAADAGGEPAAAAAEPDAVEARERPFAPSLRAADVKDQTERLRQIATEKTQALQKLTSGEMEAAEYAEIENRLTAERESIVEERLQAKITAEHNEQTQQSLFEHELKRYLKAASKEGIDYSQPEERARFERSFALVAADPANASKSFDELDELFGEAHRMVKALKGIQPMPAQEVKPAGQPAAAAAPAPTAPRQVPKTIGDLPSAAPAAAASSTREKAALLEGEDLERYLAGLPKAEHEKLLREAV